jgi:hypothetical protein
MRVVLGQDQLRGTRGSGKEELRRRTGWMAHRGTYLIARQAVLACTESGVSIGLWGEVNTMRRKRLPAKCPALERDMPLVFRTYGERIV